MDKEVKMETEKALKVLREWSESKYPKYKNFVIDKELAEFLGIHETGAVAHLLKYYLDYVNHKED